MTLTAVPGIRVGHAEVPGGGSGCTAILGPFRGAAEVRGMATGTREMGVLSPFHLADRIDGILLSGGSAFGLAAADGVVQWLAERGEGFDTAITPVPLVPGAVIFDLKPGVERPGPAEGRRAAASASGAPVREGQVGAGAGASVGKLLGAGGASPGGVGSASGAWDGRSVGVLAVVNALGDVMGKDGAVLAGARGEDGSLPGSDALAKGKAGSVAGFPGANTTLVVVGTDLPLSRVDLGRLAKMAASALPRAITPVNTPYDGDVVFCVSTGEVAEDFPTQGLLGLGVVARELTEEAIRRGVASEETKAGGFPERMG